LKYIGVGKSCLSIQATKHQFETHYSATVGFEFFSFNIKFGQQIIKLQIWDTCGEEIYRSLISNFYRNCSLAIIVYSIIE
jgi:GTPase SAR1 family protein